MTSATRALAASSLLLCAMACAAIALLTIASSATEELAQAPHATVRSSSSDLEAKLEADVKTAAAKDAGAQLLQSQLIKFAQAAAHPKSATTADEQSQLKRANAVQASLSKIAQDHPSSNVDVAGSLVARVKADDAKVQGAMSALNNALLPPSKVHAAAHPAFVDEKKVAQSVADLTKIALQLHLKQLEAKQRALHPEPSQQQAHEQYQQQQPLAINAPGQHMPRAVAAIAKAAAGVPLPHHKAVSSPSDSADAILHRAMAKVVKESGRKESGGQHLAAQAIAAAAAPFPSSPTAAATAILKAALSNAESKVVSKTSLATPFAPLKVPHAVGVDSHALALAIANAAKYESKLKADSSEVAAAAAAASHPKSSGFRVKRGDIEKAFNRAVAFENQMEQIIIDEKAEAEKQQQLPPKSAANTVDKLGLLVEKERGAQMAAISAALQQAKRRAASYAVQLKTLDEQHKDLNAQRAAAAAEAAQKRQEDAVAHAVAAAAAAKAAALRADKAKPVLHTPHAPIMPQAVSKHPSWHLADPDTPMSRVEAAEAAATAARAAVVAAEAAAAKKTKDVVRAEQHLVEADHAAEEAQAQAASSLAKDYEKKLLEGVKAKSVAAKGPVKGVAVKKAAAAPKESELQTAEEALQNILKRQEELNKQKV